MYLYALEDPMQGEVHDERRHNVLQGRGTCSSHQLVPRFVANHIGWLFLERLCVGAQKDHLDTTKI